MRRLVQGSAPTALALDVELSTALGFFSGDKHLACLQGCMPSALLQKVDPNLSCVLETLTIVCGVGFPAGACVGDKEELCFVGQVSACKFPPLPLLGQVVGFLPPRPGSEKPLSTEQGGHSLLPSGKAPCSFSLGLALLGVGGPGHPGPVSCLFQFQVGAGKHLCVCTLVEPSTFWLSPKFQEPCGQSQAFPQKNGERCGGPIPPSVKLDLELPTILTIF